uniref:Uncharacterized protein n=1 Tax=Chelonoidis abingdonii TaxID=106734 RepID=A0A8C0H5Z5_CHEAB
RHHEGCGSQRWGTRRSNSPTATRGAAPSTGALCSPTITMVSGYSCPGAGLEGAAQQCRLHAPGGLAGQSGPTPCCELQVMFRKDYGPMWKSTFGKYKNVNIGSPEILEQLLRQEGKYPMRSDMALWKEHRDIRQLPYGPFTEEGERWYRLRQVLNQRMLKPSEAMLYTGVINEVVSDLMARLQAERAGSPSGVLVEDMANLLYRFALEGISYILFETRIGCLEREIPTETRRFIDAIGLMLRNSVFATVMPLWSRKAGTSSSPLVWRSGSLAALARW